jgi:hypothetical protein
MNKIVFVLLCTLLLGCNKPPEEKPSNQRKEWPQKCEMCGAKWLVTPVERPDEAVPPTVEWCFYDGSYCEVGFQLILKANHVLASELRSVEREFLNHCLSCRGCRRAVFSPQEWREFTDAIKSIQAK